MPNMAQIPDCRCGSAAVSILRSIATVEGLGTKGWAALPAPFNQPCASFISFLNKDSL